MTREKWLDTCLREALPKSWFLCAAKMSDRTLRSWVKAQLRSDPFYAPPIQIALLAFRCAL